MSEKWDVKFIQMAMNVASWSKDPSTKVGCVLVEPVSHAVLAMGYNGIPRGVDDDVPERWQVRPEKYRWVEHAERNAIYNAARMGVKTEGAIAYLNFQPFPCEDCSRALAQAGVATIVGPDLPFPGKGNWDLDEGSVARTILKEAGLETRTVEWL
jgi:dCMP deaminase